MSAIAGNRGKFSAHLNPRTLFVSRRAWLLRAITLLLFAQVGFVLWLLSLPPRAEWPAPLGANSWWLIPGALLALSCVLPGALVWLHGRYVLRLEADGVNVRATVFVLWGSRARAIERGRLTRARFGVMSGNAIAPALRLQLPAENIDWIFDAQGDFPESEEAIAELLAEDHGAHVDA